MALSYIDDPNLSVLANEIETGTCILFLGAGISMAAGLPSWSELVKVMRSKARLRRDYGPLRTADMCRQVIGQRAFSELIAKEVGRVREPSALHVKISHMPINVFVTTNFDQLLEQALIRTRKVDPRVLALQDVKPWRYIPDLPDEPWVMKMHGCIGHSRNQLILSEEDYLSFSVTYDHVERGLGELLARKAVLFVGYSLTDWDVLSALQHLKHQFGGDTPNRYFVGFDLELPERRFLEQQYGLRVFDIRETVPGDKTEILRKFLDNVMEHFQVPQWVRRLAADLGGHIDGRPGVLDEPLSAIFPDFDVSATSRFVVRVQWELGIDLPFERIVGGSISIREFLALTRLTDD